MKSLAEFHLKNNAVMGYITTVPYLLLITML